MVNAAKLEGAVYGKLTVLSRSGVNAQRRALWLCKCACGELKTTTTAKLTCGNVVSCGCYKKQSARDRTTTHGMSASGEYASWTAMLHRCYSHRENYGGRGIYVDISWWSFKQFLRDMGERPVGTTLERNDANGAYSPTNCRWATVKEQARNTRRTINLTYGGKTLCMLDWAAQLGTPYTTLQWRYKHRWPVEAILFGKNH